MPPRLMGTSKRLSDIVNVCDECGRVWSVDKMHAIPAFHVYFIYGRGAPIPVLLLKQPLKDWRIGPCCFNPQFHALGVPSRMNLSGSDYTPDYENHVYFSTQVAV